MRFSIVHCITLVIFGLTRAQNCDEDIVNFENITETTSLGALQGRVPIPNGYFGLNWDGVFGVTVRPAAQNLLPQGKKHVYRSTSNQLILHFAAAFVGNPPSNTRVIISALPGRTIRPEAIFLATVQTVQLGVGSLPTAGTISITAKFKDGHTAQTTFNFKPPFTIFGPNVNAEALQYFQFPCDWAKVMSMEFRPQAEDGLNNLLTMVMDDFHKTDDTDA